MVGLLTWMLEVAEAVAVTGVVIVVPVVLKKLVGGNDHSYSPGPLAANTAGTMVKVAVPVMAGTPRL